MSDSPQPTQLFEACIRDELKDIAEMVVLDPLKVEITTYSGFPLNITLSHREKEGLHRWKLQVVLE